MTSKQIQLAALALAAAAFLWQIRQARAGFTPPKAPAAPSAPPAPGTNGKVGFVPGYGMVY
jgi:hypothetical protein